MMGRRRFHGRREASGQFLPSHYQCSSVALADMPDMFGRPTWRRDVPAWAAPRRLIATVHQPISHRHVLLIEGFDR
jgi:hypothetical protein